MMVDYHVHTEMSVDSRADMDAQCRRAAEIGLREIGFAEHFDLYPWNDGYGFYDYEVFAGKVEEARSRWGEKVTVRMGVEIGEPHLYAEEIEGFLGEGAFDYVIGAVHWIGDLYPEGEEYLTSHSMEDAYGLYLDEVRRAAEAGGFEVLAHLDLVKRKGTQFHGPFPFERFRDRIAAILDAIIRRGIALEVNTSGLRQAARDTLPGMETIELYRELGGELITVGSDAHKPEDLAAGIPEALERIERAGFRAITVFEARRPKQVRIVSPIPA